MTRKDRPSTPQTTRVLHALAITAHAHAFDSTVCGHSISRNKNRGSHQTQSSIRKFELEATGILEGEYFTEKDSVDNSLAWNWAIHHRVSTSTSNCSASS